MAKGSIGSIAVIGSGMAGLAAARRARQAGFEVTVFEARAGHGMDAHAVPVHGGVVDVPLRVMNPNHWHSVLALAEEVGVGSFPVDTFVSCSTDDRCTWFRSGRVPLTGWPFVGHLRYLNARALNVGRSLTKLSRLSRSFSDVPAEETLAALLRREAFDETVWRGLILPLLITICTCDERDLMAWPAGQLLGLLDEIMHGERLVRLQGGTGALVAALSEGLSLVSGSPVTRVCDQGDQVLVCNARGEERRFDRVIIATQANELDFLDAQAYRQEREVLSAIRYARGTLIVHADERFMPRDRRDWAALNFQSAAGLESVMFTVWVNAVEPTLADAPPVFQTWNPLFAPHPDMVLASVALQRAVVHSGNAAVLRSLQQWHGQPGRRVFYCGSWAHEGVPLLETAVRSAETVVELVSAQGHGAGA